MLTPVVNTLHVPAYDPAGNRHIIETTRFGDVSSRIISNTLFPRLFPGEKLVEIHYQPDFDVENIAPVTIQGEEYYPWWCYGSAIKKGIVFGVQCDLMDGVAKNAQDAYRFGRWACPNGTFGAGWGKLRIMVVKQGTVFPGLGPIEDGFAFLDKSLVNMLGSYGSIKLGHNRGSYQFWQRLPYTVDLWNELWPAQQLRLNNYHNVATLLDASGDKLRQELVSLDPDMGLHPMVALKVKASASEYLARMFSTFDNNGKMYVAIPTTCAHVATSTHGVIARYPIDDFSLYTIEPEGDQAELDRIAETEVVEYSVSNLHYHDKGHAALYDLSSLGFDMVTCDQNIKFGTPDDSEYGLAILQRWQKGSAIGVNADWGHRFGLDHDDLVVKVETAPSTAFWAAVKEQEKRSTGSFKIQKSKEPRSEETCRKSMARLLNMNLVGIASSVQSRICSLSYLEQERVCEAKGTTFTDLHTELNHGVKVGTDCFKSASPDPRSVMKIMFQVQNAISSYVHSAGYANWDDQTFAHGLPEIITDSKVEHHKKADGTNVSVLWVQSESTPEWHVINRKQANNALWPEQDGLCARLARECLRYFEDTQIEVTCEMKPLQYYLGWVKRPTNEEYLAQAHELKKAWTEIISHTPVSDGVAVEQAKARYKGICSKYPVEMAEVLWYVCHSDRGAESTGMAVFAGFPEEAFRIIREKPGLKKGFDTIIVGVQYQCPELVKASLSVEIKPFQTRAKGKPVVRTAVVGKIDGQKQPTDASYPENTIGLIPLNGALPKPGSYQATINKVSEGAWGVHLA